jgi:hypothetical protein
MPARTRQRLVDYYAPSVDALQRSLGVPLPAEWGHRMPGMRAA